MPFILQLESSGGFFYFAQLEKEVNMISNVFDLIIVAYLIRVVFRK